MWSSNSKQVKDFSWKRQREDDKEGLMKQTEVKSILISTEYVPLSQDETILNIILWEDSLES